MSQVRPSAAPRPTPLDRWRRLAAAVLAVGSAALVVVSEVTGRPDVCREATATIGSSPVVRICAPMSVADLLPLALVLLVLLWPDLLQIEALGWSITKRRDRIEQSDARSADWPGVGQRVGEKVQNLLPRSPEASSPGTEEHDSTPSP